MATDVVQLIMQGTCAGEFWETVQHWQSNTTNYSDPASLANDLINAFRAAGEAGLADCLSSDTEITGYKAKRVNNGGGVTVMTPITPVPGTQATTAMTSATAFCIVPRYNTGTKWRTGRWFIPGIPEGQMTGNAYSGSIISDIAGFIATILLFTGSLATWTYGIWSPTTTTFFVPTYVALSTKVGIQKRRLLPVM